MCRRGNAQESQIWVSRPGEAASVVWHGVAWCGVARRGMAWHGVAAPSLPPHPLCPCVKRSL